MMQCPQCGSTSVTRFGRQTVGMTEMWEDNDAVDYSVGDFYEWIEGTVWCECEDCGFKEQKNWEETDRCL